MRGVSLGDELSDEANSDADILPQQSNNNLGVMLDVWCDSDVSPSCSRKPSYAIESRPTRARTRSIILPLLPPIGASPS